VLFGAILAIGRIARRVGRSHLGAKLEKTHAYAVLLLWFNDVRFLNRGSEFQVHCWRISIRQ
jgi:hypothetical protein